MNKWIILLGIIFVFNIMTVGQVKKILILGNSYSGYLPKQLSKLALSLGDSVYCDYNNPANYSMMNHSTDPLSLLRISQADWDYVVILGALGPSMPPAQVAIEVLPYATILNDSIKSNNPCTETVFFMTWGKKYGDQQNCAAWPPVCTFLGMQERLMTTYMTIALQNNSTAAPVGLAWKHAMDNDPDSLINLYSSDNSHPYFPGVYLSASVLYAIMFQKSPVGSEYYWVLPEDDALFLQQIAEDVVLGEAYNFTFYDTLTSINYDLGWESWFDFGNIAIAGFSFSGIESTYNFFDNSLNADTYFWDFGDGNTSTLQNPSHTYSESGNYSITHSISNPCFDDNAYDTIDVVTNLSEEKMNQFIVSVYPNPSSAQITIELHNTQNKNAEFTLYNMNAQQLLKRWITEQKTVVDISGLPKGIYFVKIVDDRTMMVGKMVKE